MYDVIIVGAGVTGCAVARYLSRCQGSFLVLEREEDVCCGTSKANSAIVHAGFDAAHGSLMAKFNLRGSELMEPLSRELDFPYRRSGSLVVCMSESDRPRLNALYENGVKNGVPGLRHRRARPSCASLSRTSPLRPSPRSMRPPSGNRLPLRPDHAPWRKTPRANGVGVPVRHKRRPPFAREDGHLEVIETATAARLRPRAVVNAAGLSTADVLQQSWSVATTSCTITPRQRRLYACSTRRPAALLRTRCSSSHGKYGKGVLVTPDRPRQSPSSGPTAVDVEDPERDEHDRRRSR